MLLCDGCQKGWHTYCLHPPLESVPEEDWLCDECKKRGVQTSADSESLDGRQVVVLCNRAEGYRIGVVVENYQKSKSNRPYTVVFGDGTHSISWTKSQVLLHLLPREADDKALRELVSSLQQRSQVPLLPSATVNKATKHEGRKVHVENDTLRQEKTLPIVRKLKPGRAANFGFKFSVPGK